MYQYKFINCNKHTTWLGNADNGGGNLHVYAYVGV